MTTDLTSEDLNLILESLQYTRNTFEDYQKYPSNEFKVKRIEQVNEVISKIKKLKSER